MTAIAQRLLRGVLRVQAESKIVEVEGWLSPAPTEREEVLLDVAVDLFSKIDLERRPLLLQLLALELDLTL